MQENGKGRSCSEGDGLGDTEEEMGARWRWRDKDLSLGDKASEVAIVHVGKGEGRSEVARNSAETEQTVKGLTSRQAGPRKCFM